MKKERQGHAEGGREGGRVLQRVEQVNSSCSVSGRGTNQSATSAYLISPEVAFVASRALRGYAEASNRDGRNARAVGCATDVVPALSARACVRACVRVYSLFINGG